MGNLAGARPYYERALAIREEALGPDHRHTATSSWWMGIILQEDGDLEGTEVNFTRALENYEAALGPDHSNTQGVRKYLAAVRVAM
jgi:hypothetical protein